MDEELRRLERLAKADPSFLEKFLSIHRRLGGFDYLFAKYSVPSPAGSHGWLPINVLQATYHVDGCRMDRSWARCQWEKFLSRPWEYGKDFTRVASGYEDPNWEIAVIYNRRHHKMGYTAIQFNSEQWGISEALRMIYDVNGQIILVGAARIQRFEPAKRLNEGEYLLWTGKILRSSDIGMIYHTDPPTQITEEPWELPVGNLLDPETFKTIGLS